MSDQAAATPGWETREPPSREPAGSQDQPGTGQGRRSRRSQNGNGPTTDKTTTGASSPTGSGPDDGRPPRADPKVLSNVIADAISALSSLATMVTRKSIGRDLQFEREEARALSQPVASFLGRRMDLRGDLQDASDGARFLASLLNYAERIYDRPEPPAPRHAASPSAPAAAPVDFARPATPPAPSGHLIADAPARSEDVASFLTTTSPRGREVGAGPVKDVIFGVG